LPGLITLHIALGADFVGWPSGLYVGIGNVTAALQIAPGTVRPSFRCVCLPA
jgi:hypothetical protein